MRKVHEIEAALKERYSGPIDLIRDFSYISWNNSVKAANDIFGSMGWSSTVLSITPVEDGSGYISTVRVSVRAFNDETGVVEECVHDGVGYSDVQTTRDGRALRDTSVKAAASDGISRALKFFGDSFGLFLYDKEERSTAPSGGTPTQRNSPTTNNNNNRSSGGRASKPTEKMVATLLRNKVPQSVIEDLDFDTASAMIGSFIKGGKLNDVLAEHGLLTTASARSRGPLADLEDEDY